MPEEPIKNQVEVKLPNGSQFIFKIPGIRDEIRIGMRMRALRAADATAGDDPNEQGLDEFTVYLSRCCATFELLLISANVTWAHTPGLDGKPVVDSSKFPDDKMNDLTSAVADFSRQVNNFRAGGDSNKPPVDGQAVASEPDNRV